MLDLEYADFHKTLESDSPPKSDNHNNSNYSHVKDVDKSTDIYNIYIYIYIYYAIYI